MIFTCGTIILGASFLLKHLSRVKVDFHWTIFVSGATIAFKLLSYPKKKLLQPSIQILILLRGKIIRVMFIISLFFVLLGMPKKEEKPRDLS